MAWLRERKGHGGSKVGLSQLVVVCSPPIIGNFAHTTKNTDTQIAHDSLVVASGSGGGGGGGPDWKLRI